MNDNTMPIQKNNSSTNFSNIGHQYYYSMDINPKNDEMLKIKDEKIKMLNRKLKSYQKVNEDQSQQINAHDNLIIDYNSLNKNYLELEKRLSNLEQEKTQLTSLLTKLYLENKSKGDLVPNSNEENINDLMYLANKELANKNEIINDLENKLAMLDLTNINHFSIEKLKKFKDFYSKNLQIINDAMK